MNSQGLVNLQILAEVSQRGANVTVGTDSFPAFDIRQAETTAVVQNGDTLVIGGIIADNRSHDRTGIPYLMDIPVFGRFFGTTTELTRRTELIMLITPNVIRNREESRATTEEFKNKVLGIRNELERLRRDQERELERRKKLAPVEPKDAAPDQPNAYNPVTGCLDTRAAISGSTVESHARRWCIVFGAGSKKLGCIRDDSISAAAGPH